MKSEISRCQITNPEITKLKILLYGPVGAGKSCFINSTMSIFAGRSVYRIPEETSAGTSCTKTVSAVDKMFVLYYNFISAIMKRK